MALIIKRTLSQKPWSKMDQKQIWERLRSALAAGEAGAQEAILEMYAVVDRAVDLELTGSDVLLPHHEVRNNGEIVLNHGGLIEAAAALAADNSLTDDQRERARRHLLRHFQEMEIDPPAHLLDEPTGAFEARVSGEMKSENIPLAPGVDIAALKGGDDDPMEVVVEVPVGRSTRGWNYREQALRDIVDAVMTQTLPGYLGHQKPEAIDTEFPVPVTHWVGAMFRTGKAYFRGVIDKAATNLKRWIRTKRITQVSIFGSPQLERVAGETHVVGYKPISIDWTPLGRAGMPTRIVSVGEMDSTFPASKGGGEFDGSFEKLRDAVRVAALKRFGDGEAHVERMFGEHVIVSHEPTLDGERKFYRFEYRLNGNEVVLSNKQEVEEKREWVPVGEMKGDDEDMTEDMTLEEMLASIRSAIAKGEADLKQVFGEIGVTKEQGIQALVGDEFDKAKRGAEYAAKLAAALGFTAGMNADAALVLAGEMADACKQIGIEPGSDVPKAKERLKRLIGVYQALGFDGNEPEDPAKLAGEMAQFYVERKQVAQSEMIDRLISEKVAGEQARGVVKRMLRVEDGATEEQITGEIDALLADEVVKGLIGSKYVDQPAGVAVGSSLVREHTREKRAAI